MDLALSEIAAVPYYGSAISYWPDMLSFTVGICCETILWKAVDLSLCVYVTFFKLLISSCEHLAWVSVEKVYKGL